MCIMSQHVEDISNTSIFVSDLGRGVHCTVYEMKVDTRVPVAMILPVPILQGQGEDALKFVNLQGYPDFFKDMEKLYPVPKTLGVVGVAGGFRSRNPLKAHDVGDFIASYAPNRASMLRLDAQFRLAHNIWNSLPDYSNFGFAVFQIKPGQESKKIHPMAYTYPAENPEELFFPTVHVHDGSNVEAQSSFDHKLYTQASPNFQFVHSTPASWEASKPYPESVVDMEKAQGLLRPAAQVIRRKIYGTYPNADYVLVAKDGTAEETYRHVA